MSATVTNAVAAGHRKSLEDVRTRQAKVDLKPVENYPETPDFRREIGIAIERAISLAGLSKKELAGLINTDAAQLSRWIAGTERPQFDQLFSVEALRWSLVCALADLADGELVMSIRRRKPRRRA
jgi:ribosome-binding protein aMBF1 (putative translation factor)